jgi:hypothetical protein
LADGQQPVTAGEVLSGSLFSEPMRAVTVAPVATDTWELGLVGVKTQLFRSVPLTSAAIRTLKVQNATCSYAGDCELLRLGLQAYSLGIAYEFDRYFGLSISRVDPLPHQLEAVYDYLLKLARVRFMLADDAGAGKTIMALREALKKFIGDFSNWDYAANPTYLEVGRGLVKAAHGEEAPLVVDPFAGGGSIPLEALRFGCDAFASDLNPVACLIMKVMLEDIPRHGPELADELRKAGASIKRQAEEALTKYYPKDPDGARPIAYLWMRTVRCESPNCGAEIPLTRSFWLSKKSSRPCALRHTVRRPKDKAPIVEFQIFRPEQEREVPPGTVSLGNATCLACGSVLTRERLLAQLRDQRGGGDVIFDEHGRRTGGARLITVVIVGPLQSGREYRLPTDQDYGAVFDASTELRRLTASTPSGGVSLVPDELIPHERVWKNNPIRVHHYGIARWGDLFSARQKLTLLSPVKNSDKTLVFANI